MFFSNIAPNKCFPSLQTVIQKERVAQEQQHGEALSPAYFVERIIDIAMGGQSLRLCSMTQHALQQQHYTQTALCKEQKMWGLPRVEHGTLLWQFAAAWNISAVSLM